MKGGPADSRDELFELLSNCRRRFAWHYLRSRDGADDDPVPLGELAEHVAAWENRKDPKEITSAERKRVYTSLQQSHLPRMDRADVVEFDDNEVRLAERSEEFDVYVDIVDSNDIPWSEFYLGLGVVCGSLITAVWALGIELPFVSGLGWAAIVVLSFALSAAVHVYIDRGRKLGRHDAPPEVSQSGSSAAPADD
jgi:hypothetical protein